MNEHTRNRPPGPESRLVVAEGAAGRLEGQGRDEEARLVAGRDSSPETPEQVGNVVGNIVISMCGARWGLE